MAQVRIDLRTLFRAAEDASAPPILPNVTLASQLHDWLIAEVAFQAAIGCSLVAKPAHPPKEPYQIKLWEDLATALRESRLAQYGSQFSASVAV